MDKTKKIVISLAISLVALIVLNFIAISYTNSDYVEIPVFKESMLKGKTVEMRNISTIQVKKTKENEMLFQSVITNSFEGKVLAKDVFQGEIVTVDKFISAEAVLEENSNFSYISIPINDFSYPTCSKLKRGDKVAVYYTAKTKDISNAIRDKQRLYSNTEREGLVTCLLFDEIEVISIHDSTGKETKDNIITDILVRVNKDDAIVIANLKSQGTFDIVLN